MVVGGGVVGLCAAYYLLRSGVPVRVLEREPERVESCSVGNAGMVVPSHFIPLAAPGMMSKGLRWMLDRESPFYVRPRLSPELMRWGWLFYRHSTEAHVRGCREILRDLHLESRRLYRELADDHEFGLVERGLLMLCESQQGLDEEAEVARQAGEIGIEAEVLDARQVAEADPGIAMSVAGAVHFRQDCHLHPARLMALLRRRIREMGGEIVVDCPVDRVEVADGRVTAVGNSSQRHVGRSFVIAGGAWTTDLLRPLGLRLPLQPGKGYSLTLGAPPEMPELCSILTEAKVAVTPMGGVLRFAGTMEIGTRDLGIDAARVRGIVKSVPRYFPKFSESDFEAAQTWSGLRPVSPDGLPYLGTLKGLDNLVVATGHAMMGLSMGPVTGRLVADLVRGDEPFCSLGPLSPERFGTRVKSLPSVCDRQAG
jgi:D-amino-acid dehydrogenase